MFTSSLIVSAGIGLGLLVGDHDLDHNHYHDHNHNPDQDHDHNQDYAHDHDPAHVHRDSLPCQTRELSWDLLSRGRGRGGSELGSIAP